MGLGFWGRGVGPGPSVCLYHFRVFRGYRAEWDVRGRKPRWVGSCWQGLGGGGGLCLRSSVSSVLLPCPCACRIFVLYIDKQLGSSTMAECERMLDAALQRISEHCTPVPVEKLLDSTIKEPMEAEVASCSTGLPRLLLPCLESKSPQKS